MEGPVLLPAAWLFAMGCAWVYRRTERIAPRDQAFEAWAAGRPTILRASCVPSRAPGIAEELRRSLGKETVVATLGRPPTPFYQLSLEAFVDADVASLVVTKATILRAHATPRPLLSVAADALSARASDIGEIWMEERMFQDTIDATPAPHGWLASVAARRWTLSRASKQADSTDESS